MRLFLLFITVTSSFIFRSHYIHECNNEFIDHYSEHQYMVDLHQFNEYCTLKYELQLLLDCNVECIRLATQASIGHLWWCIKKTLSDDIHVCVSKCISDNHIKNDIMEDDERTPDC